jgi:prepilin-type processing-associated H-X9-DG protein/prepilin-type N-terminal cleavage/methylation domain-containing protein
MIMKTSDRLMIEKTGADGFTLIELAVVIATVAVLAALLLPALAGTRPNTQAFQCLENQRQLILAWQMYAQDNSDILPPNDYPYNQAGTQDGTLKTWVFGSMAVSADAFFATELVNPKLSSLASYNTNPAVYKCPADTSLKLGHSRVRSVSMNECVGTRWYTAGLGGGTRVYAGAVCGEEVGGAWSDAPNYKDPDNNYRRFGKISSFTAPGPSSTWVIMDENPYTINDPLMAVPMTTWTVDWPACYHNGSASISFADGHAELHKWVDCFASPVPPGVDPNNPNQFTISAIDETGNPHKDLDWIQPRTTAHE